MMSEQTTSVNMIQLPKRNSQDINAMKKHKGEIPRA